jgi:hypothetical protein
VRGRTRIVLDDRDDAVHALADLREWMGEPLASTSDPGPAPR